MIYIWIKLITGIVFVLIPGFSSKNNFKKHPILTILSLVFGIILLYLSIKPITQDTSDVSNMKNDIAEIKNISKKNYVKNTFLKRLRIVLTNYKQYCDASTADYVGSDFQQRVEDLSEDIPRGALSNDVELEKVIDEIKGLIPENELQKIMLLIHKLSFLRTRELNDALLPKQHEIGINLKVYEECSNNISNFLKEMPNSINDNIKKNSLSKTESSISKIKTKYIPVAPKNYVKQKEVEVYKDLRIHHIGDENIKKWPKLHGQCYQINFILSKRVK